MSQINVLLSYTPFQQTLQGRSGSIYDTLHSDKMHVENTKKKKTEKVCLIRDCSINGVVLHYMYSL